MGLTRTCHSCHENDNLFIVNRASNSSPIPEMDLYKHLLVHEVGVYIACAASKKGA